MNVGLEHYLVVSALLFCLGLLGVIVRRNLLIIYMSLELMLNAANLALVAFSRFQQQSRRPGVCVLHHNGRGGGGGGGPGADRGALSQAADCPRGGFDHAETLADEPGRLTLDNPVPAAAGGGVSSRCSRSTTAKLSAGLSIGAVVAGFLAEPGVRQTKRLGTGAGILGSLADDWWSAGGLRLAV